ncbi:MAG: tetratricopeptide repeat protein [Candidatus Pacebacteria bacterium]|nr:tetratricopeptide repeat protein [Candidatus Paceibacterota bacterium]
MTLQKIIRPIVLCALFLIPFFAVIVANPFFFPFITGKAFYFRILVEVAFVGWAVLAFLDAKYRPKLTPLTVGVSLFAVITLIADLLGVNPLRSIWSNFERMEGWMVVVHLWAFFMATVYSFGPDETGRRLWHRWFNLSLLVALYTGIYGVFQLMGWAAIHQGSTRLDASLGNAAYFAVYMLMHTGIATYMFFAARAKQVECAHVLKYIYPVLAVIFGFLVFQTQTRGTILGLIGGIVLALALYVVFARGAKARTSRIISASILGAIFILGIIFWMNRTAPFIQQSPVLNRIASISWNENKTQARGYVWPMAIGGALERPIFGWGQENFNYIFNANYNPKMHSQEQWFDRAHSVFLDWLVASGFVGLFSYLALYVLLIIAIWKKSSFTIAEKSALTGLVAGYAVHNIFVFDNIASYISFFALLGFGGSIVHASHVRRSKIDRWIGEKYFSPDSIEYIVMPIAVIGLLASVYFINVRPMQANTRLISALSACADRTVGAADPKLFEQALSLGSTMAEQEIREQLISCTAGVIGSNYPEPTKKGFYELTVKTINDQIVATPADARIYILGGSFFNALGQFDEAVKFLEKARELTPGKQSMLFQLATSYLNVNKAEDALKVIKEAYDAEPSYSEARSTYAVMLVLSGKENEAKELFKGSPEVFETMRMAQAYATLKQYSKATAIFEKLLSSDPKSIELRAQLAQVQQMAGMTWSAEQTLRSIIKDYPEYKDQVEAAIKQMQTK